MPTISRLQFLYNCVDGPDVLMAVAWLKEQRQVLSPAGHFIFEDTIFQTAQLGKEISLKFGPHLTPPPITNGTAAINTNVRFTIVGIVQDRGTSFAPLGPNPPPTPIQSFKLDNVWYSIVIGVIDSDDTDCVGIHQDQVSAIQTLGNTIQAHGSGSKLLRRPLGGRPQDVDDGCILLQFPPTYSVGAALLAPSPRRRAHRSPVAAASSTTPAVTAYGPANPGPPGTLYPASQAPGYKVGDIMGSNVKLRQPPVYHSSGQIVHPAHFADTFLPGEIIRATVEVGALSLESGLYGHIRIIELHHVEVDLEDRRPLTPLKDTPSAPLVDGIPPYDDEAIETDQEEDDAGADVPSAGVTGDAKPVAPGIVESAAAEFALMSKFADADSIAAEEAEDVVPVKAPSGKGLKRKAESQVGGRKKKQKAT